MASNRDTSKDRKDIIKTFMTKVPGFWRAMEWNSWVKRKINSAMISRAITDIPCRPNPLSCGWDYPTWEGLTNRRWSARHLPPAELSNLPPPEEVASKLFKRSGPMIESVKSTLLFPYFAQWFTDGFLAADQVDRRRNFSNHEIDLSQLYGLNPETLKLLRTFSGGRLKSQVLNGGEFPPFLFDSNEKISPQFQQLRSTFNDFSELPNYQLTVEQKLGEVGPDLRKRKLKLFQDGEIPRTIPSHCEYNELRVNPPEFAQSRKCDLFAMANDRANSTLGFAMMNILMLREHNRIAGELAREYPSWADERLFQTTRNILTVIVLRIVLEEYINHITPYHFRLFVDPPSFYKPVSWKWTNWMTVEFNVLYRWHGMIPDSLNIAGRNVPSMESLWNPRLIVDEGLAQMFNYASAQKAGRIGAMNTWEFLAQWAEIPTIQMGRDVKLGTYNDYRELCKMPRVDSFAQITGDSKIQAALQDLYGAPDRVEFYAGLFSEDLRENSALPPLIGTMVGIDAFSQALTNPLLQQRTFTPETFSEFGWKLIHEDQSISQLVERNTPEYKGERLVGMTQLNWRAS